MGLLEKALKSMEEPKKEQIKDSKSQETPKKPKEPKKKKIGISERKLNKKQTLDAIFKLGKENIDSITDIKLKSILEDIKVYSRRK